MQRKSETTRTDTFLIGQGAARASGGVWCTCFERLLPERPDCALHPPTITHLNIHARSARVRKKNASWWIIFRIQICSINTASKIGKLKMWRNVLGKWRFDTWQTKWTCKMIEGSRRLYLKYQNRQTWDDKCGNRCVISAISPRSNLIFSEETIKSFLMNISIRGQMPSSDRIIHSLIIFHLNDA